MFPTNTPNLQPTTSIVQSTQVTQPSGRYGTATANPNDLAATNLQINDVLSVTNDSANSAPLNPETRPVTTQSVVTGGSGKGIGSMWLVPVIFLLLAISALWVWRKKSES